MFYAMHMHTHMNSYIINDPNLGMMLSKAYEMCSTEFANNLDTMFFHYK